MAGGREGAVVLHVVEGAERRGFSRAEAGAWWASSAVAHYLFHRPHITQVTLEFWNAGLKIDWEDDGAYELARLDGAQALGIKVSRAHLIARLPAISQSALAAPDEPASSPDRHGKAGAKPKYDWDAIQAHCHQWFDDNGYPENASKFCRDEIIPWCEQRYDKSEIPDLETLRPYITRWIAASRRSLLPKSIPTNSNQFQTDMLGATVQSSAQVARFRAFPQRVSDEHREV